MNCWNFCDEMTSGGLRRKLSAEICKAYTYLPLRKSLPQTEIQGEQKVFFHPENHKNQSTKKQKNICKIEHFLLVN